LKLKYSNFAYNLNKIIMRINKLNKFNTCPCTMAELIKGELNKPGAEFDSPDEPVIFFSAHGGGPCTTLVIRQLNLFRSTSA